MDSELSQKILRGQRENRKKGLFCGGHIPYGYYAVNKKVVIDEDKASVVRYIFEQYSLGLTVPKIIALLTKEGLLHYGKPFVPNTVYNILRNERYIGIYRHKDEVFDNIFPRILSDDLFNAARKRIDANKFGKKSVQEVYLLRNKVKCGYCGHPISAECGTSSCGTKIRYYKCRGRKKHKNGCIKSAVRKEILEDLILDVVIKGLKTPDVINKIVDGLMELQEQQARESSMLNILIKELRQTEITLNNLLSAVEQGIFSNTTNKRLHELETRQQELEQKIAVEKSKSVMMISRSEILKYYEEALRLESQMLINYLVKSIVLYNDKIELHYNNPTRLEGTDELTVYSGTVKMPCVVQNKLEPELREMELKMII